jgi:hypothetical protein
LDTYVGYKPLNNPLLANYMIINFI